MAVFTDQTGRKVDLPGRPLRIVSAVPSQTELLAHLGLEDRLVGITAYCIQPPHLLEKVKVVGGTKDLQLNTIRALQPDLIIGNKEENRKEQIEALAREFPVWLSDIRSVDTALDMIHTVGMMTGSEQPALSCIRHIRQTRQALGKINGLRSVQLIWKDPYMVAGPDTFIAEMMRECGMEVLAPISGDRYPKIDREGLKKLEPDVVLLSSEPYRFTTADLHFIAGQMPKTLVKLVDGACFSWYGSRMSCSFK